MGAVTIMGVNQISNGGYWGLTWYDSPKLHRSISEIMFHGDGDNIHA